MTPFDLLCAAYLLLLTIFLRAKFEPYNLAVREKFTGVRKFKYRSHKPGHVPFDLAKQSKRSLDEGAGRSPYALQIT